jgi:hypothetical protein
MSLSPRLSKKLHVVLGPEAEELVTYLDASRAQSQERFDTLRADIAELRQEMRVGFEKQATEFKAQLTGQVHGLEVRLMEHIHQVDNRVANVKADLMKWSFVFWVGAVGAIAMLAGVLP